MPFPSSDVNNTNTSSASTLGQPEAFRADARDLITKFNQLRNWFSSVGQGLVNSVDAATARTTLGAAASGANTDITSLASGVLIDSPSSSSRLHMGYAGQAKATYLAKDSGGVGMYNSTDGVWQWRADFAGNLTAASFNGAGTGLTGTAASLNAGVGVGQTFNYYSSADRPLGTTFTNSTNRTIFAFVSAYTLSSNGGWLQWFVNKVGVGYYGPISMTGGTGTGTQEMNTVTLVVPAGYSYSVLASSGSTLDSWYELR